MKDNSGPAFPTVEEQYSGMDQRWATVTTCGVTKRELIAMGQMQVLRKIYPGVEPKSVAQEAIKDADALLAELAKE